MQIDVADSFSYSISLIAMVNIFDIDLLLLLLIRFILIPKENRYCCVRPSVCQFAHQSLHLLAVKLLISLQEKERRTNEKTDGEIEHGCERKRLEAYRET